MLRSSVPTLVLISLLSILASITAYGQTTDAPPSVGADNGIWKCGFATNEQLPKLFVQLAIPRHDSSSLTAFVGNFGGDIATRKPLLVYLEGSGAQSHFVSMDGRIGMGVFGLIAKHHGKTHHVVTTEKRGVPFGDAGNRGSALEASDEYNRFATLENRAADVRLLLDTLLAEEAVDSSQVILLGHSEGADVAAAVAAMDNRISHVAFLSGGGAAQFFDLFALTRRRLAREGASAEEIEEQIASLENQMREILQDPDSETRMFAGHAFKRWATFATVPSAENLAKSTASLFLAHGTDDESVPIESFDYLVVELLRNRRQDITVKRYPGCDHSYIRVGEKPSGEPFQKLINEVIQWAGTPSGRDNLTDN